MVQSLESLSPFVKIARIDFGSFVQKRLGEFKHFMMRLLDKMTRLPDRKELGRIILSAGDDNLPWIDDRKRRTVSFQTILKTADLRELICLADYIYRKRMERIAAGKKLFSSDEGVLHRSESLIENELAFVLHVRGDQVGSYIRENLGIRE